MWTREILGFGPLLLFCAGLMVWHWWMGRAERAAMAQKREAAARKSATPREPLAH